MATGPLYRRRALERISSADQLDRAVRVTAPKMWIGLSALLLVVAVAIAWSSIATVPTTLSGPAFLIPLGGLREVQAPIAGTVSSLDLAISDHVVEGTRVGTVTSSAGQVAPVYAPATGVVTETDTLTHGYVSAGERIAIVEPVGWPLVLYAYLPTDVAGAVAIGMPVRVTFGAGIGVRYGYAEGHVQSVSQYPATSERLQFTLQDSGVIGTVQALGPANEIIVALDQSAHTPSGLVWGQGSGPPAPLPSGLPATAVFITGSHHPIANVLGQ